jgi:hypothetical protein
MLPTLVLSFLAWSLPTAPIATFDWATITVERQAFFEDKPGAYGTKGQFDGVGMVYISASRNQILFRGLRRIATPHPGQARSAQYELHQETFTLKSMTPIDLGWTFEAVNDGPSGRKITGGLRYAATATDGVGTITEFRLDEHGQQIAGVLNRMSLAKSSAATSLLRRFDVVFFGANLVAYKD